MVTKGFTRKEVMALTGLKSGRLSYFDQTELVQPEKIGGSKHPVVLYSWEQLLELRVIAKLRDRLSLQQIRQVIKFLRDSGYEDGLYNKPLLFINSSLCLQTDKDELGRRLAMEVLGSHSGQLVFDWIDPLGKLDEEVAAEAQNNPAIDFPSFQKRAQLARSA